MHYPKVRDESFITRCGVGAAIFRWGVGFFFGDVLGGGENKKPLGHGGHTFY